MKRLQTWVLVCLLGLAWVTGAEAQSRSGGTAAEPEAPGKAGSGTGVSPVEPTGGVSLPRLIKFSGLLRDRMGQPRTGIVGVTFALYQDQQGGAPLWLEVQNLELDDQGRYTVLLGATQTGGLPLELFAEGKARWLGIQVQGEEGEQGRILLVSVPYALKAADAETLGGKPASAFALAEEAKSGGTGVSGTGVSPVSLLSGPGPAKEQVTGTGTVNRIAKFTAAEAVGNSLLFDSGVSIGLGTITPNAGGQFTIAGNGLVLSGGAQDLMVPDTQDLQIGHINAAGTTFTERLRLTGGGSVGIGTPSPLAKLQVNVTNPSAGTIIGSSALSVGSVDIVTTDAQGANVGPILALGGNRATTGQNLGVFGGIRGAKENSTDGNSAGYLGFYTLQAGVAFAERMRISSGGLVGMGTLSPNPGARLTLVGGLHMRGAVADLTVPDGENLQLGHLNFLGGLFTERLRITPTGNVGIGTTAPGQKLEVAGNLKLSGTGNGIIFPDATTQTTAAISPAAASALFVLKAGDTMTGNLTLPNLTATASVTGATGRFSSGGPVEVVSVVQFGTGPALVVSAPSSGAGLGVTTVTGSAFTGPVGVVGFSAQNMGVLGSGSLIGVAGEATATTGLAVGIAGVASSPDGVAIFGRATATSGATIGVKGLVASPAGTAGVFDNSAGGKILSGQVSGTEKFSVDGTGRVTAAGLVQGSGARFLTSNFFGVHATTFSTTLNTGVLGEATAAGGIGVKGSASTGVVGQGGGIGVHGIASGPNTIGGYFQNTIDGRMLVAQITGGSEVFSVDGSGNVVATSFAGSGTALTNVTASSANDLACTGCVAVTELGFDPATQVELDAEAAARASADAALQTGIDARVAKAGDTMTGTLTLPANGLVAGTNQLVLSGGNVGVGTATPAARLHVAGGGDVHIGAVSPPGAVSGSSSLFIENGGGGAAQNTFRLDGHINDLFIVANSQAGAPAGAGIMFRTGTPGELGASGIVGEQDRMTIRPDGNVGIGTTAPGQKLEVAGNVKGTGLCIGADCRTAWPSAGISNVTGTAPMVVTSPTADTRNVALNPITDANVAVGAAIAPAKIAGTAATLGANSFTGNQSINSGNLNLPATASATAGVITFGGFRFVHNFGTLNTFVGTNAGNFTMTGANNTASGQAALFSNTTGNINTASGRQALVNNTTGSGNTAIGFQAGVTGTFANANTTGSDNTFIGTRAGPGTTTQLTNATAIGANALVSASNALVLGDSAVSVGIGTPTPAQKLEVVGNVKLSGVGSALIFPDGTTQTTAGGGGGDITAVTAGTGLSGGGTTGDVTLSLASASCAAGQALISLPASCAAFATLGANTFTGDQSISGNVTAGTFRAGNISLTSSGVSGADGTSPATSLTLKAGNSPGITVPGGDINLISGSGGGSGFPIDTSHGGDIALTGSVGNNARGGNITLTAGETSPFATAPANSFVQLQGGPISPATGGRITAGGARSAGGGGGAGPNNAGGVITIEGGNGNGTGAAGDILLLPGTAGDGVTKGNVGIGTASPAQKLEVAGNVKGTGLCIAADCRTAWPAAGGISNVTGTAPVIVTSPTADTRNVALDPISDANIAVGANIATSKLAGPVTAIAGHGLGALATLSAVSGGTGGTITDATITNVDLAAGSFTNITGVGTLGSLTVSGAVTVDTNTLVVDSVNNRVGLGTSNPQATLHVAGTTPNILLGDSLNSITSGVIGATISGGGQPTDLENRVTDNHGTVGGGRDNQAGSFDTVVTNAAFATVGGGTGNRAQGLKATVGGGLGNIASGESATVPGGQQNTAQGAFSFAAGIRARALHEGAFVWGDNSVGTFVDSTAANQVTFRTTGGVRFISSVDAAGVPTAGVTLAAGASAWSALSDRASKENFAPVDGPGLLAKLAAIPIQSWNWKTQGPAIRHMGPVAQDFRAAFGLGEDDKHISTVDADGVALAAVQELYRLNVQKDEQIRELTRELQELRALVARLAAKR